MNAPKSTVVQDVVLDIIPPPRKYPASYVANFASVYVSQDADQYMSYLLTQLADLRAATWCPNGCRPLKWDTQFSAFCPTCHFSKVSVSAWGQPSPASAVKGE